jgi:hypothetical protein
VTRGIAIVVRPMRRARPRLLSAETAAEIALACCLFGIAAGLAAIAALGPLLTGVIDYHVTETLRNQVIGLDAVSLLLVAPLSLLSAGLVLRRHRAGAALALGIGAYTAYMLIQYVLGPEYERLPGNNELLFPLCLVLFTLGWIVAVLAWNVLAIEGGPPARKDRLVGPIILLPLLAVLAFGRYAFALVDWMSATPEDEGYLAGPTFAWTIGLLDLGIFLPATAATCIGLVRGADWAARALYLVVGWFGLVGPAVAAMAITMYVNDDPVASGGNALLMSLLGLAFLVLAIYVYWPLLRGRAGFRVGQ